MMMNGNMGYISEHDIYVSDWSSEAWPYGQEQTRCELCDGEGRWYEDKGGAMLTEEEYNNLSQEEKCDYCIVICPDCDGNGYIY